MKSEERFWNRVATKTDLSETGTLIIKKSLSHLKPKDELLDFGCGDGTLTHKVADHVSHIDALDFSSRMIEIARSTSHHKKIDFHYGNIEKLNLTRQSFDAILAFNVLHFVNHKRALKERFHELLKPGGYFISYTPCIGDHQSWQRIVLTLTQYVGLTPKMEFFNTENLQNHQLLNGLEIIESTPIKGADMFIVAQKPNN